MSSLIFPATGPYDRPHAISRTFWIWVGSALASFVLIVFNPFSASAVRFNQESMVGGAAIYGTLRVLNSVMSVAKDADIQASAAVASATFSPGQLLQPVTNTIDRIADLLFVLIIGSGIVAALTAPLAKIGAAVAFLAALVMATSRWIPSLQTGYATNVVRSLFVVGAVAAVVIPGAFAGAALLGDSITRSAWQNATSIFQGMEREIDAGASQDNVLASGFIVTTPIESEPTPELAPSDEGRIAGALSTLGSAWTASKNAVAETASAATSLAASIRDQATTNVKIIKDGVAFSANLLDASVQIAVAYIAKLIILPIMIFGAAIFVIRSIRFSLPSSQFHVIHDQSLQP